MPYKRKAPGAYIGGRRYVSRRVTRRRPTRVTRRPKRVARVSRPHAFHRWITAFQSGVGTLVNVTNCVYDGAESVITCTASQKTSAFSLAFQLYDIPNLTEFSSLFDNYMLTGVMLQFKLMDNPDATWEIGSSSGTANRIGFFPTIWYTTDHDDNNNVTLAQIKEYERVRHRVLRPNRETNIMLRPTTLSQLFRTSITTGYAEDHRRRWLDMANSDIPHYGFKSVIDMEGFAPATTFRLKVNAKYFFSCKNVR